MPTALFDLTPLSTEASTRGIGRYVADLGVALHRAAAGQDDLRVLGLERLHMIGTADVTEDIEGALLRLVDPQRSREELTVWAYRLRIALAPATRAIAPDLVHSGHPGATPLGELNCPRVVTCHDLIPLKYPDQYLDWRDGYLPGRQRVEQRRFTAADHVIAVSRATADDLVRLLHVPASRISVIPHGIDPSRWSPEPQHADADVRALHGLANRDYLLYVGGADWHKNPEGMFAALAAVRKRAPDRDPALAWAGQLRPKVEKQVRAMALDAGVAQALVFTGYVNDQHLGALYRGATAGLFVSRAEGFGYPLLEAMSTGCPIVTSNSGSMSEIAGDAAFRVDVENTDAVAEAVLTLFNDSNERRSLASRGISRASHYSTERMAADTLDVYRTVLSSA